MPRDVNVSPTKDASTEVVLVRHLVVNQVGMEEVAALEVCLHKTAMPVRYNKTKTSTFPTKTTSNSTNFLQV